MPPVRGRTRSLALGVLVAVIAIAEVILLWQAVNISHAVSIAVLLPVCGVIVGVGLWLASRLD